MDLPVAHLVRRFFGAVRPGPPPAGDEAWARRHLLSGEQVIWTQMNNPDRRHAVAVARAVADTMDDPTRPVLAAALLHDAGKLVSKFRTPSRVLATVVWAVVDESAADRWLVGPPGYRRRLAEYRRHPELGRRLLIEAGSEPLTSDWAAQHHAAESVWTVPIHIGRVLKDCDDD